MERSSRIALRGVRAFGRHGADAGEREHPQPFEIDVVLDVDLNASRDNDTLSDTLDYAALHRRVVALVSDTSFALLERLGQHLLDEIFEDARVTSATVTIAKPQRLGGATPSVTLTQSRVGA